MAASGGSGEGWWWWDVGFSGGVIGSVSVGRKWIAMCQSAPGVINDIPVVEDEVIFCHCFLGGGMDGHFNASLEAGTKLGVSAGFFPIHAKLG